MRKFLLALAAATAFAAPASAAIVFEDNFEGEAGGATVLNYNGFANWDVIDGTVDLLNTPNQFGLTCAGGSGSCVDLDGSTGDPGVLITKGIFDIKSYEKFTLTLDLGGSQRTGPDGVVIGFLFTDPDGVLAESDPLILEASDPFSNVFTSTSFGFDGSFKLFIRADPGTPGSDNIGALLDNVSLDIAPVPEPATWAMMITGFGMVGGAMRMRQPRRALAA